MKDSDPLHDQRAFWEARHAEGSLAHLSGVPGDEVIECLGIDSLVTPSSHVLEIGVGLGTCVRYLGERCEAVYAVDIAKNALDRVRDVVRASWLECEMESLPLASFDLVILLQCRYPPSSRDVL